MNFVTPFTGKPGKPVLSGLFLFDPSVLLKLSGHPVQAIFKEEFGEALAKRMERASRENMCSPELLNAFLDALPAGAPEFVAQLRRAAAGDATAVAAVEERGPWGSFYASITEPLTYSSAYRLAVERASRLAEAAFRRSDYDACAQLLDEEALLKPLLCADVMLALKQVKGVGDVVAFQFAVAMEVELSCLAALDVSLCVDRSGEESVFSVLLPDPKRGDQNPPTMFFRWLRQATGLRTLAAIEARLSLAATPIHLVTLKNWSRGRQIPNPVGLRLLMALCPNEADRELAESLYWATKLLNLLGYYSSRLVTATQRQVTEAQATEAPRERLPWPRFPFGYDTFGDWARGRYPYWLAYHRARLAGT